MKKAILLFALVFCFGFTMGQVTFYKTIKGYNEGSKYIEQTDDGGYIIAGTNSNSSYYGYVIKTNSFGDTIWTKVYGKVAQFYSGKQTSDGGYVLLGVIRNFTAGNDDIFVLKIDSVGIIQWQKQIDVGSYEIGKCIKQTSDGGYIISANNTGPVSADVIKLDLSGNLQWSTILVGDFEINSIAQTNSGGYIATGTKSVPSASPSTYLLKLNNTGVVQWSKTFSGGVNDYSCSILQTDDSGYMILGATDTTNSMSIIKTDSLGNLLWGKSYRGAMGNYTSSIKKTNHGNFIISSAFTRDSADYNIKLLFTLIDSTGNELWSRFMGNNQYPGLMFSFGTDASQTTDGGYIFTGSSATPGAGGFIYFIKADSMGRNGCNDTLTSLIVNSFSPTVSPIITTSTSGVTISSPTLFNSSRSDTIITYCTTVGINELKNTPQISVYPNPSSNQFNFSGLENGNKIELFNIIGQSIYQTITNSDFKTISMNDKAKGIYFYRITKDSKLIQQGKIILIE